MTNISLLLFICTIFLPSFDAAPLSTPRGTGDGLLRLPLRHKRSVRGALERRQDLVTLTNTKYQYLVDVQIGTPPQPITLSLDTGSSDIWVYGTGSCSTCEGGVFDPTASSSTVDQSALGTFSITYFDQTTTSGYYITDDLSIGSAIVTGAVMAVATASSDQSYGILGVGMDGLESDGGGYHNIIDMLASDGIISTRAYSVYLDDLSESTGALILGGVDSSKYTGDLVSLPIAASVSTDPSPRLNVEWTSLSLTDSTGTSVPANADLPYPVALDTGYTLSELPTDLFGELVSYFSATQDANGDYTVPCDLGTGGINFGFGDGSAVTISVPFSELAVPYDDPTDTSVCQFGFIPYNSANNGVISFGDTMLRSAYVVYNYDAMTISLAQASWDNTCDDCAVPI